MSRVITSRRQWDEWLQREYPGVHFDENGGHRPGINAITEGLPARIFHLPHTAFGCHIRSAA